MSPSLSLRRVAELMNRNRVIRKRLPHRYGSTVVYCSPDNNLRTLLPGEMGWDRRLFDYVDAFVKPGDVVWDVGANHGAFTFSAAARAKAVVAIEADIFNAALLQQTCMRSPHLPVTVLNVAATNALGISRLRIAERGRSANSLEGAFASTQTGGFRGTVTVMSAPLDWLSQHVPAPDVVKIDTEGAEEMVLSGAHDLVREHRPLFIVEVAAGTTDHATFAFFQKAGYSLFDAYELGKPQKPLSKIATGEVIAVPSEKPHSAFLGA
jgi:FkbM family methyltransferase